MYLSPIKCVIKINRPREIMHQQRASLQTELPITLKTNLNYRSTLSSLTTQNYRSNFLDLSPQVYYIQCIWRSRMLIRIFEFAQGVKRELPSLISTNTLPASPLEIRSSSSRYVVSNHDSALLFEIENFTGGWLEMVFATDEAVS